MILNEAQKLGYSCVVAGIKGEAEASLKDNVDVFEWIDVGKIMNLVSFFKKNGVKEAVFAGKIDPRIIFKREKFNETSHQILAIDKDSITDFQREMYNGTQDQPKVGTRFSLDFEKRVQSNHIKEKLDQVPAREGEVVYTASKKYDVLFGLSAHIEILPVRVKEKYVDKISICYQHNLGHNVFLSGECKIDEEHFAYTDVVWADINSEVFVKKRELYNRMIGKVPFLEDWSSELPGYNLIVPQPFSFTRATQVGLPIWKSANNKITFHYYIRTKLSDLIRMRLKKDNGEYKEIKCNLAYLEYGSDTLPVPQMWGRYGNMSDEEKAWRTTPDPQTGNTHVQTIYVEDIDITSSKNPKTLGTTDEIPLKSMSPAKHVFWTASLVNGNMSNYSTNRENVYQGWNPCARASLKYGNSNRVEDLSSEHFDLAEFYDYNWPNFPREPGYNVFTYTFEPNTLEYADNAVVLGKCGATLNVTLGDTDPFLTDETVEQYMDENGNPILKEELEDDQDDSKKDKYIVHVRTVVIRKLEVFWDPHLKSVKYKFL